MKQQSQIILMRKNNYQVLQNLILEAPKTQRKMAWYRSFGNKARIISLLFTYQTVPSYNQGSDWDNPCRAIAPALECWGTIFFKLSKKAEALAHHFQTHLLRKTDIFNMFYRTSAETLPVQMPFRTSSYHHLALYWQAHWNHSLIPAKKPESWPLLKYYMKSSHLKHSPCCCFISFLLTQWIKSHGSNTNILLPCEELCKSAEIHK